MMIHGMNVKKMSHENTGTYMKMRIFLQKGIHPKIPRLRVYGSFQAIHRNKIFPHLHEFVNDFGDGKIMFFDH